MVISPLPHGIEADFDAPSPSRDKDEKQASIVHCEDALDSDTEAYVVDRGAEKRLASIVSPMNGCQLTDTAQAGEKN